MLIYVLYFFLGLNLTYLIGHFCFNFFSNLKTNTFQSIFLKSAIGVLSIIFFTAIYYSKLNTIILGIIIPVIFLALNNKFKFNFKLAKPKINELIGLNVAVGIPIIIFQLILHPGIGKWTLIPVDLNYYSEITYYLKQGYESKYGTLSSFGIRNIPSKSPYHYAELWLNCFYSTIFTKAMIGYTLLYVTYPILISVFFSGVIGFAYNFTQKKYLLVFVAFLVLFLGPIDSLFFRNIFDQGHLLSSNTVVFENNGFFFNTLIFSYHGQKHALFYVLFLLFINVYQKNSRNAFILLSICPLINFGLLPGLFSGIIIYSISGFLLSKFKNITLSKAYILPLLTTTLFYWLFYKINDGKDIEKQVSIVLFNSKNLNLNGEFARIFFRIVYCVIYLVLIYIWCIPLLFQKKIIHSKFKELFLLLGGILLCVVMSRPILEGFNSAQIISYLLPALNVILSLTLIHAFFNNQSKKIKSILLTLLLLVSTNNIYWTYFHSTTRREINIEKVYSKSFTSNCLNELEKIKNPKIGYFLTKKEATTIESGFWYGYYPCEFIFTKDYYKVYSLNYPYYNKEDGMYDFATNHMRYIFNQNISMNTFYKKLPSVIKSKKLDFIISKAGYPIPSSIESMIERIYTDSKSKHVFIVLKK